MMAAVKNKTEQKILGTRYDAISRIDAAKKSISEVSGMSLFRYHPPRLVYSLSLRNVMLIVVVPLIGANAACSRSGFNRPKVVESSINLSPETCLGTNFVEVVSRNAGNFGEAANRDVVMIDIRDLAIHLHKANEKYKLADCRIALTVVYPVPGTLGELSTSADFRVSVLKDLVCVNYSHEFPVPGDVHLAKNIHQG